MVDIRSVESGKYNTMLAETLKESGDFEKPDWIAYVRTGTNKKRPTEELDFWHKRAASILRQIYIKGIVGVERLRTRYGGRKNRGMQPPEFRKSGGKIIRLILQQAEKACLIEKSQKPAGRKLTKQGKDLLESIVK
ncbi:30S ribosomal protein S19e [Candidatus Pacearchaeota archaeon CG10_big_fil_rev_8_21_14_0_10_31_24]|nr:MAG: 30S ribosomal protein S19e [Candidatus Pacearchaeota archaeon CG10_big_fil_rev_8_21_14_0_10_31_24]